MIVTEETLENGKVRLTVEASSQEVSKALARAQVAFAEQMKLKPDNKKPVAQLAAEQMGVRNLNAVVAPQALGLLAAFAAKKQGLSPAVPPLAEGDASLITPGKGVRFDALVLKKPECELTSYEPVSITMAPFAVDEGALSRELKRFDDITDEWVRSHAPAYKGVDDFLEGARQAVIDRQQSAYEKRKREKCALELAKRFRGTIPGEVYKRASGKTSTILRDNLERRGIAFEDYVASRGGERAFNREFSQRVRQDIVRDYSLDALYRHEGLKYSQEDLLEVCAAINPGNPQNAWDARERMGRSYELREEAERLCAKKWLVDHADIHFE